MYDEFSTIERSLITQFSMLIGDSSPDYTEDPLMCLYVVGYVFICTLSLLNFLLAIVVNGESSIQLRMAVRASFDHARSSLVVYVGLRGKEIHNPIYKICRSVCIDMSVSLVCALVPQGTPW